MDVTTGVVGVLSTFRTVVPVMQYSPGLPLTQSRPPSPAAAHQGRTISVVRVSSRPLAGS